MIRDDEKITLVNICRQNPYGYV